MALDGITSCEVAWDFQGASPVLQVTDVGTTPETTDFEKKKTAEILLSALRQGRLNLNVSSVGGIHITKAKTARERKEGMFDWKFFNALVNPDADNTQKLIDVLHHRPTMHKVMEILDLVNPELHDIAKYILTQLWRAKDILDSEGVR
jgi:protein-tyrosine phosphatase